MGQTSRAKPKRLPEKLTRIRKTLGMSQNGIVRHLGLSGRLSRGKISEFERGEREPTLVILLRYARAAGVWMDVLVDDELDLPEHLPATPKHEGIPRKSSKR
jgi:transcriptional regulator with XRE-family HTH domain